MLQKLKGSSLILSVFFILVLLIILGFLISIQEFKETSLSTIQRTLMIESVVETGLDMLLTDQEESFVNTIKENEFVDWNFEKQLWGCYDLYKSKAIYSDSTFQKVCLVGSMPEKISLHVDHYDGQINISQYVSIIGGVNFYRPDLKLIPTRTQVFDTLFRGSAKVDLSYKLSGLNKKRINERRSKIRDLIRDMDIQGRVPVSRHNQSFLKNPECYSVSDTLSNLSLSGNIVLKSEGDIFIDSLNDLRDIWIVGNNITIQNGFKGQVHLSAYQSISIGSNCEFQYPSSIALVGSEEDGNQKVEFNERTRFSGVIIGPNNRKSTLILSQNGFLEGQIIWPGQTELKGLLYGAITCGSLFEATDSYFSSDALNGVIINRNEMNMHILGVPRSGTKKVLKWVN